MYQSYSNMSNKQIVGNALFSLPQLCFLLEIKRSMLNGWITRIHIFDEYYDRQERGKTSARGSKTHYLPSWAMLLLIIKNLHTYLGITIDQLVETLDLYYCHEDGTPQCDISINESGLESLLDSFKSTNVKTEDKKVRFSDFFLSTPLVDWLNHNHGPLYLIIALKHPKLEQEKFDYYNVEDTNLVLTTAVHVQSDRNLNIPDNSICITINLRELLDMIKSKEKYLCKSVTKGKEEIKCGSLTCRKTIFKQKQDQSL